MIELVANKTIHGYRPNHLAWSHDGTRLATVSMDAVEVWESRSGRRLMRYHVGFEGFYIASIAWSADDTKIYGGTEDARIIVWSGNESSPIQEFDSDDSTGIQSIYHADSQNTLYTLSAGGTLSAYTADSLDITYRYQRFIPFKSQGSVSRVAMLCLMPDLGAGIGVACASGECSFWDKDTELKHTVCSVRVENPSSTAISQDGSLHAIGTRDGRVIFVNLKQKDVSLVIEGITGSVSSLAFSPDNSYLASASSDDSIRIWDSSTGKMLAERAEPHGNYATSVRFSPVSDRLSLILAELPVDELLLEEGQPPPESVRLLDCKLLFADAATDAIRYKRAKILVLGNSGVGKTCLTNVIAGKEYSPADSTQRPNIKVHTAHIPSGIDGVEEIRETYIWDLAGQAGYRVVNQLHLNDASTGLITFDSKDALNPLAGVAYWSTALAQATRIRPAKKLLAAARIDRNGIAVSQRRLDEIIDRYKFESIHRVSARRGDGIDLLRNALFGSINWSELPTINAPRKFQELKQWIVEQSAKHMIIQRNDLLDRYASSPRKHGTLTEREFDICIRQLDTAGVLKRLTFGRWIILRRDVLDDYCSSVALAAREEPDGLGGIAESCVLDGDILLDEDRPLANDPAMERLMLAATVQEVVGRQIAYRENTDIGTMLIFPAELRTDMPEFPGKYVPVLRFAFDGPLAAVYATLAVRLRYSVAFRTSDLYHSTAVFRGPNDQVCGFRVEPVGEWDEARGLLTVFFGLRTSDDLKLLFLRYIDSQIEKLAFANSVTRERIYQCDCGYVIDPKAVILRLERGAHDVVCSVCDSRLALDTLKEDVINSEDEVVALDEEIEQEASRQERVSVLQLKEHSQEYQLLLCSGAEYTKQAKYISNEMRERGILTWYSHSRTKKYSTRLAAKHFEANKADAPSIGIVIESKTKHWFDESYAPFINKLIADYRRVFHRLHIFAIIFPEGNEDHAYWDFHDVEIYKLKAMNRRPRVFDEIADAITSETISLID